MRRAPGSSGFTLLEVMVALAIMAISLTVLLQIATNNARATNHARMVTTATFLARGKMVDIEDVILEKGFTDTSQEDAGDFRERGFPEFTWESFVERVELPADATLKTQQAVGDQTAKSPSSPMQLMTGFLGGIASSFVEPIRVGLQESVRKVTLTVVWSEPGRPPQTVELVEYVTDPARLDMALPGAAGSGTAASGTGVKK